jgi:hypothetical protein
MHVEKDSEENLYLEDKKSNNVVYQYVKEIFHYLRANEVNKILIIYFNFNIGINFIYLIFAFLSRDCLMFV